VFGVAGYNGSKYGKKPDGSDYMWTQNVSPARIYVGIKGLKEDGTAADPADFLARNGLRYGQLYGYAINMTSEGPTKGLFRDKFHLSLDASNGKEIKGKWIAQPWRWNGTVTNFEDDGSWDYQLPTGTQDFQWWNPGGINITGFKSEHGSPVSLIFTLVNIHVIPSSLYYSSILGHTTWCTWFCSNFNCRLFWPLLY
jgi:hypothetical protein